MRKVITIIFFTILLAYQSKAQNSKIAVSAGYPFNYTDHWMIAKWENPVNTDFRFVHSKKQFAIGGGIDYSKYDITWFQYYNSDENSLSNLSPYLLLGFDLFDSKITLMPYLNLGYSKLFTDAENYNGKEGGLYSALGVDFGYSFARSFQLGLGSKYHMVFNQLDFDFQGIYPQNIIPSKDKVIKSLSIDFMLAYKF